MATKPELPTIPHARLPQFGRIVGGPLDGWSYGLVAVEVERRSVFLVVNATPPNWCFPDLVRLNARSDFKQLRNPGEIAPYLDSSKLIERAVEAKKYGWDS
jgi:hypothetical protein